MKTLYMHIHLLCMETQSESITRFSTFFHVVIDRIIKGLHFSRENYCIQTKICLSHWRNVD